MAACTTRPRRNGRRRRMRPSRGGTRRRRRSGWPPARRSRRLADCPGACLRCFVRTNSVSAPPGSGSTGSVRRTSSTRSGRKSTNWPRWWRPVTDRIRRAPRRRWAICCSPSPTSRENWASSRKRRCARRTRSSRAASTRWSSAIVESGRRMQDMSLEELEEQWQQVKRPLTPRRHEEHEERQACNRQELLRRHERRREEHQISRPSPRERRSGGNAVF